MQLSINKTWDGEPLDESETAEVHVALSASFLELSLQAPYYGDPSPPGPPGPTESLWDFEVVEVFIVGASGAYTEIQLSPHGHHLVLQLSAPRVVDRRMLPLKFNAQIKGDSWSGRAKIPLSDLPERPVRINAFAIHGQIPNRRHLAWTSLPGAQPDFHQPHRFEALCVEGLNKGC